MKTKLLALLLLGLLSQNFVQAFVFDDDEDTSEDYYDYDHGDDGDDY